jgi:hypothetical protein
VRCHRQHERGLQLTHMPTAGANRGAARVRVGHDGRDRSPACRRLSQADSRRLNGRTLPGRRLASQWLGLFVGEPSRFVTERVGTCLRGGGFDQDSVACSSRETMDAMGVEQINPAVGDADKVATLQGPEDLVDGRTPNPEQRRKRLLG